MKLGFFGTSTKEFERRIPLHPDFFDIIDKDIKEKLFFEQGYGKNYGIEDNYFINNFGGVFDREELFENTDVWVLPKPNINDFKFFSKNKILFGWPHCVQGKEITDALIKNEMTVVAWESMYGGKDNVHLFQTNNEIAGYAAVHHSMSLLGKSGYFGSNYSIAVLGFGSTARGAIHGLQTLGYSNIDVFTKREPHLINAPIVGINYNKIIIDESNTLLCKNNETHKSKKLLRDYDIIVNCVLQNPIKPIMFCDKKDLNNVKKTKIVIDVSCDEGMAFDFAVPTTFKNPILDLGNIKYYSIDHTPSYYYDAASYEISKSILPFIRKFTENTWEKCEILNNAIEIKNGKIINKKIIEFQKRS